MQYTEKELTALINEVEKEFSACMAKAEAEQPLNKSEAVEAPAAPKTEEAKVEQSIQPLAKAEEKEPEKKEPEKKPEEEKKEPAKEPEKKPEEKEPEKKPEEKKDEDKCDYNDDEMEEMHKMYKSMSKAELGAHQGSVAKAMECHGLAKCGEIQQIAKSEPNPEVELLKAEVETHKAKAEELKKSFDLVAELLTKLVKKTAPEGKAITSYDTITKGESVVEEKPLSKNEITAILAKKASDPTLSKTDREAINSFYFNGATNINGINHLLKAAGNK